MAHVNRALVVELLSDGSLSYREIARRAACSDFSVRAIARSIDANGDDADRTPEPLTPRDWFAIAGILAFLRRHLVLEPALSAAGRCDVDEKARAALACGSWDRQFPF